SVPARPFPAFFFYRAVCLPVVHSFPTRRSSDLFLLVLFLSAVSQTFAQSTNGPARPPVLRSGGTYRGEENSPRTSSSDSEDEVRDRKSTRLNSSHSQISYAVICLKKKTYTLACG